MILLEDIQELKKRNVLDRFFAVLSDDGLMTFIQTTNFNEYPEDLRNEVQELSNYQQVLSNKDNNEIIKRVMGYKYFNIGTHLPLAELKNIQSDLQYMEQYRHLTYKAKTIYSSDFNEFMKEAKDSGVSPALLRKLKALRTLFITKKSTKQRTGIYDYSRVFVYENYDLLLSGVNHMVENYDKLVNREVCF